MINLEVQKCGADPWQYCHKWHGVPKFQIQEPEEGQKKNQRNDHYESGEENWLQLSGMHIYSFVSVQALSHVRLFVTPWTTAMPGLPVHRQLYRQLPEFTQTHVYWVSDAIQPSHPLSSPSPLTVNLSQHQGFFPMSQFFASGGRSIGVSASTSVPSMNIQDWFPLRWTGQNSLHANRLSRVFSNTTVQRHQIFGAQLSLQSSSHIHTWLLDKPLLWLYGTLSEMWCLYFLIHCLGCHSFPSKKQPSFNFMAAVTICSDFGAQENKVCHCFHFLAFYLPWSDGTRCHDLCFLNAEF